MKESDIPPLHSATPRDKMRQNIAKAADKLPPGKLRMVITYLEMTKPPVYTNTRKRLEKLSILRSRTPTVSYYRYLYKMVGDDWMWYERNEISDDDLLAIIHDPLVHIYILYVDGTPAGFVELDYRVEDEVELAYFGLVTEYIGLGLGTFFLQWAVETAWHGKPKRVWVHTCNFDHPKAISTYQKVGFLPYDQTTEIIDDPKHAGDGE